MRAVSRDEELKIAGRLTKEALQVDRGRLVQAIAGRESEFTIWNWDFNPATFGGSVLFLRTKREHE